MTHSFAIETTSLTRSFGSCIAVDAIDLRVPRGNVYGFLGPNGAGKTTTIRLLLGLLRADSGSIVLDGQILSRYRRDIMRRIGALVETPTLYPHLTGRENLELTRRILDVPESRVKASLDVFGLAKDADRLVRTYSLGMRQRLGLALAWLGEPRLLLLDEPANGLDPAGIRELRNQIRGFAHDQNVTVFLSSHVLREVEQLADQIGIIHHGRLLFQGRFQDLQTCRPPLTVITDRNSEAAAVLKSNGWQVVGNSCDSTAVRITSDADIAAINRSLLDHGIQVYRLERAQETFGGTLPSARFRHCGTSGHPMRDFYRLLGAEIAKLRRTLALRLAILGPVIIVLMIFGGYAERRDIGGGADVLIGFGQLVLTIWTIVVFPLYAALVAALLASVEHQNETWRHLLALPVRRSTIFLAKWMVGLGLLLLSFLVLAGGVVATAEILRRIRPAWSAWRLPTHLMFRGALLSSSADALLFSIQMWISLRWRSFLPGLVVAVIALALMFVAIPRGPALFGSFFPWSLPAMAMAPHNPHYRIAVWWGLLGGIVLGAFACWRLSTREFC